MAQSNQLLRYVGGIIALLGLSISAAFIGRRTFDPVISIFFQPLTIWTQILGIVLGLIVLAAGLRIMGLASTKET